MKISAARSSTPYRFDVHCGSQTCRTALGTALIKPLVPSMLVAPCKTAPGSVSRFSAFCMLGPFWSCSSPGNGAETVFGLLSVPSTCAILTGLWTLTYVTALSTTRNVWGHRRTKKECLTELHQKTSVSPSIFNQNMPRPFERNTWPFGDVKTLVDRPLTKTTRY